MRKLFALILASTFAILIAACVSDPVVAPTEPSDAPTQVPALRSTPIRETPVTADTIESEPEEQITLTFDLPLSNSTPKPVEDQQPPKKENKTFFSLDEEVNDIDVNEPVEIRSTAKVNEQGEKRYTLNDFDTVQSPVNTKTEKKEVKEEITFEKKTIATPEPNTAPEEEIDPMNSPISDLLISRADERRRKMKDFNYKFNNAKINEIEKVPAYKRQGVNLEDAQHSSENTSSRMSVGTDDNDDIQLRSNNSFLHDNVD